MSNWSEEPVGHGPLADLIRHLEDGSRCRADACSQGDKPCPCPQACQAAESDDYEGDLFGVFRGLLVAIGFTLACVATAALIAWRLQ